MSNFATNIFNKLMESVYPWYCAICGTRCYGKGICEDCEVYLPWCDHFKTCEVCGLPITGDEVHTLTCGECQKSPPSYDRLDSVFWYQSPINEFITQYKYFNRWEHIQTLTKLTQENFNQVCQSKLIIPMPSHPQRIKQRGFNAIYEIGKQLIKTSHFNLDETLVKRIKHTETQTGKTKSQRRKNLNSAFTVLNADRLKKHPEVIIIDEVVTTGATVNELSRCLKKAGANKVKVWAIARTMRKVK